MPTESITLFTLIVTFWLEIFPLLSFAKTFTSYESSFSSLICSSVLNSNSVPKERAPVPVVKIRSSSLGKFEILTCCAAMLDEVAETFAEDPSVVEIEISSFSNFKLLAIVLNPKELSGLTKSI